MNDSKPNTYGAVLRAYSTNSDSVELKIKETMELANKLLTTQIQKVHILVWTDPSYKSDCGLSLKKLESATKDNGNIEIVECSKGGIFCGILNLGIAKQIESKINHSFILSSEASSYVSNDTINEVIQKTEKGALMVSVAINEVSKFVKQGIPTNTFCVWNNLELMKVGGFSLRSEKPLEGESIIITGTGGKKFHLAGCEEVIPAVRLVKMHKKCIDFVIPKEKGEYKVTDSDDKERVNYNSAKFESKEIRYSIFLSDSRVSRNFLEAEGLITK